MMDQWEAYQPFRFGFISILDPRFYTPEWLDGEVYTGTYKLFTTDDAAILVELKVYPTELMEVHGVAATGDMGSIVSVLIPQAEQWGREQGAEFASIASRPGWARVLKDYAVHQVYIRKAL